MKLDRLRVHNGETRPEDNSDAVTRILATICSDFKDLTISAGGQYRSLCQDADKLSIFLLKDDRPHASVSLEQKLCNDGLIQK
ncbi:hypothetical protein ES703_115349 [subsurface metagenome]